MKQRLILGKHQVDSTKRASRNYNETASSFLFYKAGWHDIMECGSSLWRIRSLLGPAEKKITYTTSMAPADFIGAHFKKNMHFWLLILMLRIWFMRIFAWSTKTDEPRTRCSVDWTLINFCLICFFHEQRGGLHFASIDHEQLNVVNISAGLKLYNYEHFKPQHTYTHYFLCSISNLVTIAVMLLLRKNTCPNKSEQTFFLQS